MSTPANGAALPLTLATAAVAGTMYAHEPVRAVNVANAEIACDLCLSTDGALWTLVPQREGATWVHWVPPGGFDWEWRGNVLEIEWLSETWGWQIVSGGELVVAALQQYFVRSVVAAPEKNAPPVPEAAAQTSATQAPPRQEGPARSAAADHITGSAPETVESILAELDALIGLENVKAAIRTHLVQADLAKKREAAGLKAAKVSRHLVFAGPPGTGKNIVARIVGRLFTAAGLLGSDPGDFVEVHRADLVGGHLGETAMKVEAVFDRANNGVLFIDEVYSLQQSGYSGGDAYGSEAVDTLMKLAEDRRDRICVILAGYGDRVRDFMKANPGLESRFSTVVEFESYSPEDLVRIARLTANNEDYALSAEAEERLLRRYTRLLAAKSESFGNARVVREDIDTAIRNQATRIVSDPNADHLDSLIQAVDITDPEEAAAAAREAEAVSLEEAFAPIYALPGLERTKEQLTSAALMMEDDVRRGVAASPQHFLFVGPPGTFKTSVAREFSLALAKAGIGTGRFREFSKADIKYKGDDTPASCMTDAYNDANGGVLFVDEAYLLSQDDWGEQSFMALLTLLNDNPRHVTVIFAGYEDDIAALLTANPGFQSRFSQTIHFDPLNWPAMRVILDYACSAKKLELTGDAADQAMATLQALHQAAGEAWGNAREVTQLVTRANARRALRTRGWDDRLARVLEASDFVEVD